MLHLYATYSYHSCNTTALPFMHQFMLWIYITIPVTYNNFVFTKFLPFQFRWNQPAVALRPTYLPAVLRVSSLTQLFKSMIMLGRSCPKAIHFLLGTYMSTDSVFPAQLICDFSCPCIYLKPKIH